VKRTSQGSDRRKIARGLERAPSLKEFIDKPGMQIRGPELGVFQNLTEEGEVGSYAADIVFAQRTEHAGNRVIP
jgi:hypothetical protein